MEIESKVLTFIRAEEINLISELVKLRNTRFKGWKPKTIDTKYAHFAEYFVLNYLKKRGYNVSYSNCILFGDRKNLNNQDLNGILYRIIKDFGDINDNDIEYMKFIADRRDNLIKSIGLAKYNRLSKFLNEIDFKGFPDIFAFKDKEFFFIEVKYFNDRLKNDQLNFILKIQKARICKSKVFFVMRGYVK